MLTVLVLFACATPGRAPRQNPSTALQDATNPSAPPVQEPTSGQAPGVTVTLGSAVILADQEFLVDHNNAVAVDLVFTLPMDRASVEAALRGVDLPRGSAFTWQDDRHLRVDVPEGGSFAINVTGVASRDGTRLYQGIRHILRPPTIDVAVFTIADLKAAKQQPARSWTLTDYVAGFTLGPDGRTALLYPTASERGSGPLLLDLPTGKRTPLGLPQGKDIWYAAGGWLPDGRICMVGAGKVWVGAPGAEMKSISAALAWTAVPSLSGRYLALWGPNESGYAEVADLQAGTVRRVPGPFRRGAQDGGVNLGWSPDGTLLAGTDFDREDGAGMKIRIIDPFKPQQVRTIVDAGFGAWLPDGSILAVRRETGGGEAPYRNVILDATGKEIRLMEFGGATTPSPDGRYLLYNAYKLNYGIIDLQTGERFGLNFPGVPRWTSTVELVTIRQRPGQ